MKLRLLLLLLPLFCLCAAPAMAATVPFAGCKSDGQLGPLPAPKGTARSVHLNPGVAARLAYFKGSDIGVLGPRGWHCLELEGSSGALLLIEPAPFAQDAIHTLFIGGPVIQASEDLGGTSGRFEVAKFIARLFPACQAFARKVIAEGLEPAKNFPPGPFAEDRMQRNGTSTVFYRTPPHQKGLGTMSRLAPDQQPIDGVVRIMGSAEEPTVLHLAVRLPDSARNLAPAIIQDFVDRR